MKKQSNLSRLALWIASFMISVVMSSGASAFFPGAKLENCATLDYSEYGVGQLVSFDNVADGYDTRYVCFGNCDPTLSPIYEATRVNGSSDSQANFLRSCESQINPGSGEKAHELFYVPVRFKPGVDLDLYKKYFIPPISDSEANDVDEVYKVRLNKETVSPTMGINFSGSVRGDKFCVFATPTAISSPIKQNIKAKYRVENRYPTDTLEIDDLLEDDTGETYPNTWVSEVSNCVPGILPGNSDAVLNWSTGLIADVCTDHSLHHSVLHRPFFGIVMECIEETLFGIFYPVDEINNSGTTFFTNLQDDLREFVRAVLALYIIIFSLRFAVSNKIPEKSDITWLVIKLAFIVYFTMFNGMADWFKGFWRSSQELATIFMQAGLGIEGDAGLESLNQAANSANIKVSLAKSVLAQKELAYTQSLGLERDVKTDIDNYWVSYDDAIEGYVTAAGSIQFLCDDPTSTDLDLSGDSVAELDCGYNIAIQCPIADTDCYPIYDIGELDGSTPPVPYELANCPEGPGGNPLKTTDALYASYKNGCNYFEIEQNVLGKAYYKWLSYRNYNAAKRTDFLNKQQAYQDAIDIAEAAAEPTVGWNQTATGGGTYSPAALCTKIEAEIWGGGAVGRWVDGQHNLAHDHAGGAGGFARGHFDVTTPGQTFSFHIGSGGNCNACNGGQSWFGSSSQLYANGGGTGGAAQSHIGGSAGGSKNVFTANGGNGGFTDRFHQGGTAYGKANPGMGPCNSIGGGGLAAKNGSIAYRGAGGCSIDDNYGYTQGRNKRGEDGLVDVNCIETLDPANPANQTFLEGLAATGDAQAIAIINAKFEMEVAREDYCKSGGGSSVLSIPGINVPYYESDGTKRLFADPDSPDVAVVLDYYKINPIANCAKPNGTDDNMMVQAEAEYNKYFADVAAIDLTNHCDDVTNLAQVEAGHTYAARIQNLRDGRHFPDDNSYSPSSNTVAAWKSYLSPVPGSVIDSCGLSGTVPRSPTMFNCMSSNGLISSSELACGASSSSSEVAQAWVNLNAKYILLDLTEQETLALADMLVVTNPSNPCADAPSGNTNGDTNADNPASNYSVKEKVLCLESELQDVVDDIADYRSNPSNDLTPTVSGYPYCDFRYDTYAAGYEYLMLWDTVECKIRKYLGMGLADHPGVPHTLAVAVGAFFASKFGLLIFLFSIIFIIFTITLTIRIAHIYLLSFMSLVMMVYVSPLVIPAILFQKTKTIFDFWLRELIAKLLIPIMLFSFLSLMFVVTDHVFWGDNKEFEQHTIAGDRIDFIKRNDNCVGTNCVKCPFDSSKQCAICDDKEALGCIYESLSGRYANNLLSDIFGPAFQHYEMVWHENDQDMLLFFALAKLLLIVFITNILLGTVEKTSDAVVEGMSGGSSMSPLKAISPARIAKTYVQGLSFAANKAGALAGGTARGGVIAGRGGSKLFTKAGRQQLKEGARLQMDKMGAGFDKFKARMGNIKNNASAFAGGMKSGASAAAKGALWAAMNPISAGKALGRAIDGSVRSAAGAALKAANMNKQIAGVGSEYENRNSHSMMGSDSMGGGSLKRRSTTLKGFAGGLVALPVKAVLKTLRITAGAATLGLSEYGISAVKDHYSLFSAKELRKQSKKMSGNMKTASGMLKRGVEKAALSVGVGITSQTRELNKINKEMHDSGREADILVAQQAYQDAVASGDKNAIKAARAALRKASSKK